MRKFSIWEPHKMPPTLLRIALACTRCGAVIALILAAVFATVGFSHFLLAIGNYPEPRHRHTVGALFILQLAPVAILLHFLARRRIRQLRETLSEDS